MNKKIWIDGYEANVLQRVGSGKVAFELLRNIESLDAENEYTILISSDPLDDLPKERQGWKYKKLKINFLKTRLAIPLAYFRSKEKPDIFFTPTHYLPRFINVKKVVTIFDLSHLHFPQMFEKGDLYKLTNWTKYSIENASAIITISQSSKKDIIKNYGVDKNLITVAYPGYNSKLFYPIRDQEKIKSVLGKYGINEDYIIYIGTIQPRKNLVRLIEAFKKIENLKLVIVGKIKGQGKKGWMNEEILRKPAEVGIEEKVIFTDFVEDKELPYLLSGAKAFILPSLWEGFGIPVVEAMACGVPVIVSNVSSLPEVAGNAGLLINPESVDQIEQAIRLISTDKKLHNKLSKLASEQAKKFSWKRMGKEVVKVLESV